LPGQEKIIISKEILHKSQKSFNSYLHNNPLVKQGLIIANFSSWDLVRQVKNGGE
jgi:hypothetical protein